MLIVPIVAHVCLVAVSKRWRCNLMVILLCETGEAPDRVAVVRDAFTGSHDLPRPLADSIASLGGGSAAISSELSQHHRRLIADEYQRSSDGTYVLKTVATDLIRCSTIANKAMLPDKLTTEVLMRKIQDTHPCTG